MVASVQTFVPKRLTQISHDSPLTAIDLSSQETAERPPSTWYMVTVKLHLNSVILAKGACYCTIDLKDFYLMTPMPRPDYMRMRIKDLPKEFVTSTTSPTKPPPLDSSTYKFKKECMAYHRWVVLHKNSWRDVSTNMATVRAPSLQASGDTTIDPYHSHFVWMTLLSSMSAANMLNTLPPFSASTTSAHTIGMDIGTLA